MLSAFEEITGKIYSKTEIQKKGEGISDVYKVYASKGTFILKYNPDPPQGMFLAEKKGLDALKEAGALVPTVIDLTENEMLLEYLEPREPDHAEAGRVLARIHRNHKDYFGLDYDNFIGRMSQKNTTSQDWIEFFWNNRIKFPLDLYCNTNSIDNADQKIWDKLHQKLPMLLNHDPTPSLIHGDLWIGNLYWGNEGPFFIDPAIYYADALMDLAFTEMFGGFRSNFYNAYHDEYSIPTVYKDLKILYQIYPYLVHANHFGGSYYPTALSIAKYYL